MTRPRPPPMHGRAHDRGRPEPLPISPIHARPHQDSASAHRGLNEYARIIFGAEITQWDPSRVPNPNPAGTQRGTQPKANRKPITNIFRGWVSEPNPYPVGTQWVMGHGIKHGGSMPKPQKLKKIENPPQEALCPPDQVVTFACRVGQVPIRVFSCNGFRPDQQTG